MGAVSRIAAAPRGPAPAERGRDRRGARRGAASRSRVLVRADAPPPGRASAAGGPRAALPAADLDRRPHGEPADPAVRGRRGGHARAPAPAAASRGRLRASWLPRRASAAAPASGRAGRARAGASGCCSRPSALYALQALYSADRAKAAENVAFFYVPFALLFVLLRDVRWTRELLLRCLGDRRRAGGRVRRRRLRRVRAQVAVPEPEGGRGQPVRQLLPRQLAVLRPEHLRALPGARDDRASTTVVLWSARRREMRWSARRCSRGCSAGLVTSFSQSSIAALLLGLAVLAAWRWDACARPLYVVGRACSRSRAPLVLLRAREPALRPEGLRRLDQQRDQRPHEADLGRPRTVRRPPAAGLRLGLVRNASTSATQRSQRAENATSASHTIPVTVAAEQGCSACALRRAAGRAAFSCCSRGAGRSPPRIALAACFAALVLHTWAYADFLEDPFTWALLAIGVALARARHAGGRRPARQ